MIDVKPFSQYLFHVLKGFRPFNLQFIFLIVLRRLLFIILFKVLILHHIFYQFIIPKKIFHLLNCFYLCLAHIFLHLSFISLNQTVFMLLKSCLHLYIFPFQIHHWLLISYILNFNFFIIILKLYFYIIPYVKFIFLPNLKFIFIAFNFH